MDKVFGSVFSSESVSAGELAFCLVCALIAGVILACMCCLKNRTSKSFFIATIILPVAVTMVIAIVNGNIGVGVAVAGAFGLVRFRSAQGTAKEICVLFIGMAAGLAFGTGYIAYGLCFTLVCGALMLAFDLSGVWEKNVKNDRTLKIVIPEELDYDEVFNDVLSKYTEKFFLNSVKTINMGSMFKLNYSIKLKDEKLVKEFIDELRVKNGNLEILLERAEVGKSEL